jgi:hypothetical protein
MKVFFTTLALLLMIVLLALYQAPAALVPLALQEVKARGLLQPGVPELSLGATRGTVWQGEADNAHLQLGTNRLPLGKLSWSLKPQSLWKKKPELQLAISAPDHQMQATVSANRLGEVTVHGFEGRFPIAKLEPWMPLLVKGDVAFVIDHLIFTQQQLLALDGAMSLEYVDWLGGEYDMPLGSYMAQLSLDNKNNIMIELHDFAATLGLNGFLSISPQGHYHFNVTLQPRDGLAPEVAQSVVWLGKKNLQGDILINQRGRF